MRTFPLILIIFTLLPAYINPQSVLPAQGIKEYPNPFKQLSEAVLKARALKFQVDLLLLDHNGEEDQYGNYIGGGFVGAWLEYEALIRHWSRLTLAQEAGTIAVELVYVKSALDTAADRLMEAWELVKSDLKKVKEHTKNLPPK